MALSILLWAAIVLPVALLPFRRFSAVQSFALACMLAFSVQLFDLFLVGEGLTERWGLPTDSLGFSSLPSFASSVFLHGDLLHLLSNMIFFVFLGSALEERSGKAIVILSLVFGGVVGSLAHLLINYGDHAILIGASGAVSGVMGAVLYLHPSEETPMFLGPIFLFKVPVYLSVGFFLLLETVLVFMDSSGRVAHDVHIAGFLAGALLGALWSPPGRLGRSSPREKTASLKGLALDARSSEALKNIRPGDPIEVRQAWAEKLASTARCGKCGGGLSAGPGVLTCARCGRRHRF